MRNKDECKRCVWRGYLIHPGDRSMANLHCNRTELAGQTSLYIDPGKTKDRRGDDPEHCLLFEEGKLRKLIVSHNGTKRVEEVE